MSLGPMGMNSGMDINSMVSKIVNAERVPKQQRIDNQQSKNDASISAYGRLRESLDTMKNLMMKFRQDKAFAARKVETSNENVVSATATTDAIAGRYAVDVLQLAQSHKVASDVLPENAKFGPGKLHVSLGDQQFSIDVRKNSKLIDVVKGINNAKDNPGVRTSVINDVDGPRMIVASTVSGEEHRVKISAEAQSGDPLKKLEYKTLEERVKDLEKARAAAQDLISPLTDDEKKIAQKIADKMTDAAKKVDQEVAQQVQQAAQVGADSNADSGDLSDAAVAAAAAAGEAAKSLKPEDRIPGWSETASGTLLDSYWEPEVELDAKAAGKAPDVPGWSNTASGTLTDSYVTPKEAQQALDQKIAQEQVKIKRALDSGEITPDQAKQMERAKLTPEERAHLEKVDTADANLKAAQESFDTYRGMTEVQAGQDSKVVLDGVAHLSSDNNIIENAIEGVDLTLKGKTEPNKPASEIDIEYDRPGVRKDIEQFVAAYNQFYQTSQQLGTVDQRTGKAGPLAGDSVVRSSDAKLKRLFSSEVAAAPENLKTLTEFGITTTRQGTLEINYNLLNKQLNNNFNKLSDFFGGNDGFARKVEDTVQQMTGVTGSIRTREKSLTENNRRLVDDQSALDRRMDSLEKRTHSKFSAMQDATGKMQSQLAGMMNALG
ncbi:flagellar filament capping protein FliD [Vibrio profundum]|uniref:flagellar filament capping protein FliD n=1 Tax=Vibrio profundum TaxID=2910247 RepID=UPI003D0D3EFB